MHLRLPPPGGANFGSPQRDRCRSSPTIVSAFVSAFVSTFVLARGFFEPCRFRPGFRGSGRERLDLYYTSREVYYNSAVGAVVQTRLDEETKAALESVARQQGKSVSDLVREGIRMVVSQHSASPRRKWVGVGKYDAGIPDLSTNPKYMEGFGLDRPKRGHRR